MLIPMKCFTCGKPISDKWEAYIENVNLEKANNNNSNQNELDIEYIDISKGKVNKTIEGNILDTMNIDRYCCRRMFLTNVHLI
ncbi:MAG: DNA-directed RNA polymerase subunit N [Candidatus Marinimicrobia bacterium]|nr:DNA-directed RNA polymerase subunit N [Candidatus Neomarinimicrobiota bacterium]|tara:strand:+ start:3475 stop:3723 length:249 start_codon:yes stop_codon:yes gene_type:complete